MIDLSISGDKEAAFHLSHAPMNLHGAYGQAMIRSVALVRQNIASRTPKASGKLARSIQGKVFGADLSWTGRVRPRAWYAHIVEGGALPHVIGVRAQARRRARSKKAKRLRTMLFWAGARHPVAVVHHPGMAARHMFKAGFEASRVAVETMFRVASRKYK